MPLPMFLRCAAALFAAAALLLSSQSAAQILIPTVATAAPPALTPNQVVDLSEWRLDLPENSSGELYQDMTRRNASPPPTFTTGTGDYNRSLNASKTAAQLQAGFTSRYFYVNRVNGVPWLNLVSPIFGSTSTPDEISNNTRTEFRSLLDGGGPGALSDRIKGIHRPRISGRWKIVQASAGETSGTADICQIHPGVQEAGYTGPVQSSSVFLIFLWRKQSTTSGRLESAVRDVTNPGVVFDDPATTGVIEGRPTLLNDFRIGDELDFVLEWDTRGAQHFLRYTLQQFRNDVQVGTTINFDHEVQTGWAYRYHYLKAGAYSSTNVLDSADARTDPAPVGFPSRNSGGLLAPENVTDVNWIAFRALNQQLMNPGGLPE